MAEGQHLHGDRVVRGLIDIDRFNFSFSADTAAFLRTYKRDVCFFTSIFPLAPFFTPVLRRGRTRAARQGAVEGGRERRRAAGSGGERRRAVRVQERGGRARIAFGRQHVRVLWQQRAQRGGAVSPALDVDAIPSHGAVLLRGGAGSCSLRSGSATPCPTDTRKSKAVSWLIIPCPRSAQTRWPALAGPLLG